MTQDRLRDLTLEVGSRAGARERLAAEDLRLLEDAEALTIAQLGTVGLNIRLVEAG